MAVRYIEFAFPHLPQVRCAFHGRNVADTLTTDKRPTANALSMIGNASFDAADAPQNIFATRYALQQKLGFHHWLEVNQVHGDAMLFDAAPNASAGLRSGTEALSLPQLSTPAHNGLTASTLSTTPNNVPNIPNATLAELCAPALGTADGLATARVGDALVIKTADCQSILLAHESGKYIAALHAGWRGNRMNFPASAVRSFCAHYGVHPQELFAVRGPSLGPNAAEFIHFTTEWGDAWKRWYNNETKCMNLWALTRYQLENAGLLPERIYSLDLCTHTLTDQFFSYRRGAAGRQASLIWIEK